ncbi:MAG: hypothetical protein HQL03_01920 [Nitrospirae bacterium]|nr:hypothetical protein [Nitrospirota bacterium]
MKRSLAILLLLVVALVGVTMWGVDDAGAVAPAAYVPGTGNGGSGAVFTAPTAGQVAFVIPYLHTAAVNPVYCVISNPVSISTPYAGYLSVFVVANSVGNVGKLQGAGVTGTGAVTISGNPSASDLLKDVTNTNKVIGPFQTRMISFEQKALKIDGVTPANTVTISPDLGTSYSGIIVVDTQTDASGTLIAGSTATCQDIGMACFQGTSSPKRNVIGYYCIDSQAGAAGITKY